jgi:hypothetical protein
MQNTFKIGINDSAFDVMMIQGSNNFSQAGRWFTEFGNGWINKNHGISLPSSTLKSFVKVDAAVKSHKTPSPL